MTETVEILRQARELISDPAHWTQGEYARDADGNFAAVYDPAAVCFCSLGAIAKVMNISDPDAVSLFEPAEILDDICFAKCGVKAYGFNDSHTHAEVLSLFDAAIARLA
jgi:hypothetical protein